MKRTALIVSGVAGVVTLLAAHVVSQPPAGPREGFGGRPPSRIVEALDSNRDGVLSADELQRATESLLKLDVNKDGRLSEDEFRPQNARAGAGEGTRGPLGPRPVPAEAEPAPAAAARPGPRLATRGALQPAGDGKLPFAMTGDAVEGVLGDPLRELNGRGVRLMSGEDRNQDGKVAGAVTCTLTGVKREPGRWYRVRVNGLAQPGFAVERDELFIKVEFFKDDGRNSLDFVQKSIYGQVELERKSLADSGTNKSLGPATWRNYSIDVRTPFAEVDTLQVSVGMANGKGVGPLSEFWVAELEVVPIPDPADYQAPVRTTTGSEPPALQRLVKLGGRWYFDPRDGEPRPTQFDHSNVDRLYYLSDRLETPFVGNTSAWLRRGYRDIEGNPVEQDRWVDDSVVVSFTETHLVVRSKNLPNHPVAVFPDRSRFLDGNPNVIRERRDTWHLPLNPQPNANRPTAMTLENKRGLPMGPIGIAMNGVVFYNPFDHIAEADAVWRLDRCCGHPSPNSQYHYHKYPVCVNTPWADDGAGHSPLIGFAFDGFPVYGPYEAAGELAKDSTSNPLNEYNAHEDAARGPHYHVTPGKFPHIIGGYWGEMESSNRAPRRGPR